jgi:outer membrane protein assembly factor BamE (lipoprotein component of BamABCDE complex)
MTAWPKVLALALLLTSSACVSAGNQAISDTGVVSKIAVGKSTRSDVAALLGYPLAATYKNEPFGEVTWHYYDATAYPNATELVPLAKGFTQNLKEYTRVLSVTFNKNGTVKNLKQVQVPRPAQQVSPSDKTG